MIGKVLVTGADGFIGSHLVEHLLAEGQDVRAFVLYNSLGSWGWLDHLPYDTRNEIDVVSGDVRDPHGLKNAMRGCTTVLHLAALIGIPYSYHSPDSYVDVNVKGTLNALQAARELGIDKLVQVSTSEVYGNAQFVPITEDHPLVAQSPYAATKIAADQLALSFHASFDTPVAIARPFNTYGPRQSARAIIGSVISQIAAGSRIIKVGALTPTRDFNFVADTVGGLAAVARSEEAIGEVINIGSNHEVSIARTIDLIVDIMGAEVEFAVEASRLRPRSSEVERLLADTSKAQNLLNWKPHYAGLDGLRRGLTKTAEWFSDPRHRDLYKIDQYAI